ncbi:hypothetical protein, partial [Marinoscillum sp.]
MASYYANDVVLEDPSQATPVIGSAGIAA